MISQQVEVRFHRTLCLSSAFLNFSRLEVNYRGSGHRVMVHLRW